MPQTYRITDFIAHVADPQSGLLTLSNLPTPIGAGSNFPHQFFEKYLAYPESSQHSRLASFRDRTSGVVGKAMTRLMEDPDSFVAVSQDIALHMNKVLQKRSSTGPIKISSGDLMVARFQLENGAGNGGHPNLAVMKIHPTKAVLRHPETDHGQRVVKIFESDESVPAPAEDALQKIAIVAPEPLPEPRPHDVVILDQQIGYKDVATFFFDEFLETDLARDPDSDAVFVHDIIAKKLSQAPRMVSPQLTAGEQVAVVVETERILIANPDIVLEDLVGRAVGVLADRPLEARKKIQRELTDRFGKVPNVAQRLRPEQRVLVSPRKIAELSATRIFTFDYGVTLKGPSDKLAEMMTLRHDADGKTVVTITTSKFAVAAA